VGFLLCPTLRCAATMPEPIISCMDKPDYVVRGVMRCGDCGTPLRLGVDGWAPCKNHECIRNKLASSKSEEVAGPIADGAEHQQRNGAGAQVSWSACWQPSPPRTSETE
jgi:hypothetical protein